MYDDVPRSVNFAVKVVVRPHADEEKEGIVLAGADFVVKSYAGECFDELFKFLLSCCAV